MYRLPLGSSTPLTPALFVPFRRAMCRGGSAVLAAVLAAVAAVAAVEYTNQFAVVVAGGRQRAERAAAKHGCSVVDTVRTGLMVGG